MKGKLRRSIPAEDLRVPEEVLHQNGRDIPIVLVNNVTYLGVTFVRRMTWRHHTERTAVKALCMYVRTYCLFKSGLLSTAIKLALYKALIRSMMTYACPFWEYAAAGHLLLTAVTTEQSTRRYWET
jgi:hypothetical protein